MRLGTNTAVRSTALAPRHLATGTPQGTAVRRSPARRLAGSLSSLVLVLGALVFLLLAGDANQDADPWTATLEGTRPGRSGP